MNEAPMNREQQIKFMTEAAKRRAHNRERWSDDDQVKKMLSEPAEFLEQDSTYIYSRRFMSLKSA